jgi:alpha-tubulin suppressor-like RCC1 family protein
LFMNLPFKALATLSGAALLALVTAARAAVVAASYSSVGTVPLTAAGYTATGNTVDFALNFAPPVGTSLTVVKVTGLGFIDGRFDNLAQGQKVALTYGGITYPFVANYYGGSGNDLVLQWANTRAVAWGRNSDGQLGNGSNSNSSLPVPVTTAGVLAGKEILALAVGGSHNLALCADGTLAAWGLNDNGQLGDGSTTTSKVPVLVNREGVLAGKTIIAIAAGMSHSLALCGDGTLAAWGSNYGGQLGNASTTRSSLPVAVNRTGVLAGKTVIAIAAGESHSLALCVDGIVAAWGYNSSGQLGNTSTINSSVPVWADRFGVLNGKTVIAVAAGGNHSLALCADGTVAAWGYNSSGQLGNGSTTSSNAPVLVDKSGVLAGKTPIAVSGGSEHSLALCADGALAGWGRNSGRLGNGSGTGSTALVPVLVNQMGALAGKTVTAISGGDAHSLALCSDGNLAGWGANPYGQLGDNGTSDRSVPVLVSTSSLQAGERFVAAGTGMYHSLAVVASRPPALVTTLAADAIRDSGATLRGSVSANGISTAVSFQYGLTAAYGVTVDAAPASLTGVATTAVSVNLIGLPPGTTYHFRVVATSAGGTVMGDDMTFTPTDFTLLTGLDLSTGTLLPGFSGTNRTYAVTLPSTTGSLTVTPVLKHAASTAQVNGVAVTSGTASSPLNLAPGNNPVNILITAADGINAETYTVIVTRLPQMFTFGAATAVPVTVGTLLATGNQAVFELTYPPAAGTNLTVVNNTGPGQIQGAFSNLAQGQRVNLTYGGISYPFEVNYHGGNGNDLVLHWANTRVLAWGANGDGQLGNGSTTSSSVPVAVDTAGVLAGKTIIAIAAGGSHCLALCADGTLASWGENYNAQLGNGSGTDSSVPVLVNRTGVLAGKTIIAIAAGYSHSLALCVDGTMATWGGNYNGELGNGSTNGSGAPVLVNTAGVLAGKTIMAIAAGGSHNLALCTDGTLATWGLNSAGQLGNGSTTYSINLPVLVNTGGVLAGKSIRAIAAGGDHSLTLCSDGALAAWGANESGQLGNNSTTNASVPVLVNRSGALAGRTVVAASAGGYIYLDGTSKYHSLALCSDGALAAWGSNSRGQLGDGSTTNRLVPVLVSKTAVLAGKTITGAAGGVGYSLARCSDGTLAAWGYNDSGRLGNGSTTDSLVPVRVSGLRAGETFVACSAVLGAGTGFGLVAMPPPPAATTLAATGITDTDGTLNGTVSANGGASIAVSFQYGFTASYGTTAAATPATVGGTTDTAVSATLSGLLSGITYHYRVVGTSATATVYGEDLTFTTTKLAGLTDLTVDRGTLSPAFSGNTTSYTVAVPYATSSLAVTPVVEQAAATVKVNGAGVTSGTASGPLDLIVGNNPVAIMVTAADGVTTKTYTVTVTRLPRTFSFSSATDVPVTTAGLLATGIPAVFELNYLPAVGTKLTVVEVTGPDFIGGRFDDLAQGQLVNLMFGGIAYPFVANYFGGTGNDLVLQWGNTRALAWGYNFSGQLGTGDIGDRRVPTPVDLTGVLWGKILTAVATKRASSIALGADGTPASWGSNFYGQLGNNSSQDNSLPPVLVDRTGVLANKTVIAVQAGFNHNLALCSDGTAAAWGDNS